MVEACSGVTVDVGIEAARSYSSRQSIDAATDAVRARGAGLTMRLYSYFGSAEASRPLLFHHDLPPWLPRPKETTEAVLEQTPVKRIA